MHIFFIIFVMVNYCHGNKMQQKAMTIMDPNDSIIDVFLKIIPSTPQALAVVEHLKKGVFDRGFGSAINDSCREAIAKVVYDLNATKPYALSMFDSWGKPESGLLEGNSFWEGRYYECLNADEGSFKGKFCAVSVKLPIQSPLPSGPHLTVAGCFPDKCSINNISSIFQSLLPPVLYGGAGCSATYTTWGVKEIIGITVLVLLSALVVASTLYDYLTTSKTSDAESSYNRLNWVDPPPPPEPKPERCHRVLISFSVLQNGKHLLSTTQRPTDIACLHGLRFLSMSWVILGHSFAFALSTTDNGKFLATYVTDHYEFQVILNAFFSVDSFFYLSGLLVAYLGLRELAKRNGKINVPMMYLHRYLRLTPAYAFVLLMMISLWPKFGEGPTWSTTVDPIISACDKYWYTNLLYFNNLYPAELQDECLNWGWYLANDTQFYLLSPLLLWLMYKYPKCGISVTSFILLSSVIITGAFSSHTSQQPMALYYGLAAKAATTPLNITASYAGSLMSADTASKSTPSPYMSDIYAKPWCRVGAYLVGMLTGYVLHTHNNKIKMNKIVVTVGWLFAFVVNFQLVYCLFPSYSQGKLWNVDLAAFYNAVSRPVWCLGLAWLTVACVSGYGGPINKILSWKAFIPLSRLTYCCYLLHPLVLLSFINTSETQFHYSIYSVVMLFLASLVLTHLYAFVVAMLIEFPVASLMKTLQRKEEAAQHTIVAVGSRDDELSLIQD